MSIVVRTWLVIMPSWSRPMHDTFTALVAVFLSVLEARSFKKTTGFVS